MQDEEYNFNAAEAEYFTISKEDDDSLLELKQAVYTELNEAERRILVLYLDAGTYAGAARILGVAPNTIKNKIKQIKWKLS